MRHLPLLLIASVICLSACSPKSDYQSIEGKTMGTTYHITLKSNNQDSTAIQAVIDARLQALNHSMSTYIKDSTISKFNRLPSNQPITLDKDFLKVLQDSQAIYQASGGSFDPTVYPLVELWGFGSKMSVERLQSPPTDEQINTIKDKIGLTKIVRQGNNIYKTHDGIGLDFSAIAKGYGVDTIAAVLTDEYKIQDYMVEIGGEVATKGKNPQGKAWVLGIDTPVLNSTTKNRETFTTLSQTGDSLHVATSGGYRNSVELNGIRYSHTINPTTAKPVVESAPSVTVIHDSTALADGWATALTAVPYVDALKMANQNHIKALFIINDTDSNGFKLIKSDTLAQVSIK